MKEISEGEKKTTKKVIKTEIKAHVTGFILQMY